MIRTTIFALLVTGAAQAEMRLTSPDIPDSGQLQPDQVFAGFGCTGGNLAPALIWSGAPEGTESFVLTVHDPDAPTGSGWWHWAVFNLPAGTTALPEGSGRTEPLPSPAVQARNDFSQNAYGGACPPEGAAPHRYVFTVYAMPVDSLPLDDTASSAMVSFFAKTSALDSASLTATYGR